MKKNTRKQHLAKVSPLLLIASCVLLTFIISVFAITNYNREKQLRIDGLVQKGMTILRFFVSDAQISLHMNYAHMQNEQLEWVNYIQTIMLKASDHPGVANIRLLSEEGIILASSESEQIGDRVEGSTFNFLNELRRDSIFPQQSEFRFIDSPEREIFLIATPFPPLEMNGYADRNASAHIFTSFDPGNSQMENILYEKWLDLAHQINLKKPTVLVELELDQFHAAMNSQRFQILFLSIVLLFVGLGGWLSLLTMQGLKGSQTRLQNIRAFNDMLISSLPVGMIATDDQGAIRICNTVAEEILHVHEDEIVGASPSFVLPQEIAMILAGKNSGKNETLNKKIVFGFQDERKRTLQLIGMSVIDSQNHYAGNILIIRDISQVVELEDELHRSERLAALGKMAAGVAHELRNPLSSIKGLAVLLQSKFINTGQGKDILGILVGEVERLDRSIGELLEYARPGKLRKGVIDLNSIVQKAVSLIYYDAEQSGIFIETDMAHEVLSVEADSDKLNQVLLNLFINSIQAMEEGGVMKIETFKRNNFVICQVSDTGCGMDLENQSRVFDPYFTTKAGGTGLGLAMTAKILYEHDGTVELRSQIGKGTTVTVRLPAVGSFSEADNQKVLEN